MRKFFALTIFMLFFCPNSLFAAVTYTYQGNAFSSFSSPSSYDASDTVTGSFTIAAPLAPNLSASDIGSQVVSYSFADGLRTLNENNSDICSTSNFGFRVGTDASGNINIWGITLCTPVSNIGDPVNIIFTIGGVNSVYEDEGASGTCILIVGGACDQMTIRDWGYTDRSGTWEVKTSQTTIPSMNEWGMIIFMVLAGLGAVYYMRRQRRAES